MPLVYCPGINWTVGQAIVFRGRPAPEQRRRQKYNGWLQARTLKERSDAQHAYVGQVENLPPIVNRLVANGPIANPIANRPAGYLPAPRVKEPGDVLRKRSSAPRSCQPSLSS